MRRHKRAASDKERPVPRLSIVIPCLGGAADFDGTLVSVLQNRPRDCEVIVAHTQAYDDPYALSNEVTFLHVRGSTIVELLNAAIDEAAGVVVHVVGCGLTVEEGWTEPAIAHFDDHEIAAVTPVILHAESGAVVAAGVRWSAGGCRHVVANPRVMERGTFRLRAKILGPTLWAGFYRRELLAALGGFDVSLGDGVADVAAAFDLRALGGIHVLEPDSQILQQGELPTLAGRPFSDGRAAERLFWRDRSQSSSLVAAALHPFAIVRNLTGQRSAARLMMNLAGRLAACIEFGGAQRQEARLIEASELLREQAAERQAQSSSRRFSANQESSARRRAA
jgi:hypothetical protein